MTEAQPNREMYGKTLVELGEADPRIIVFEADIAKSTNTWRFQNRFPERFFQVGTAELNMVCMAAGAATTGLIPFCSTFVVFASMRACEGVRTSIAYPKLNVKIVATNAGVEIAGDGVTHQGIEDLAILRAMPNMTVLAPSDPVTTRKATLEIARRYGPCYMRLGRQTRSVLYPDGMPFEIGKAIQLRDGDDIAIVACGTWSKPPSWQRTSWPKKAFRPAFWTATLLSRSIGKPFCARLARPAVSSQQRITPSWAGWAPRSARW